MEMARDSRKFFWPYPGFILAFVSLPLVVIIFLSSTTPASIGLPFIGFSLQWYYQPSILANGLGGFLADTGAILALQNSVTVGLMVAVMSTFITVASALSLRRRFRGRTFFFYLILSAFVVPGVGTLPVYLYTRIQTLAPTPEFYAIGTVVTSVAIALVIAAGLLLSRNQRRLF